MKPQGFRSIQAILLTCVFATVLPGCGDDPPTAGGGNSMSQKVKDLLEDEAEQIISGATKLEAFRLDPNRPPSRVPKMPGEQRIGAYLVLKTAEVKSDALGKVQKALSDDKAYFAEKNRHTCFDPGIAFRLTKGNKCVDVLVSIKCKSLRILVKQDKEKEGYDFTVVLKEGKAKANGIQFQPVSGRFDRKVGEDFLKVALETFSDDEELILYKDEKKKK